MHPAEAKKASKSDVDKLLMEWAKKKVRARRHHTTVGSETGFGASPPSLFGVFWVPEQTLNYFLLFRVLPPSAHPSPAPAQGKAANENKNFPLVGSSPRGWVGGGGGGEDLKQQTVYNGVAPEHKNSEK